MIGAQTQLNKPPVPDPRRIVSVLEQRLAERLLRFEFQPLNTQRAVRYGSRGPRQDMSNVRTVAPFRKRGAQPAARFILETVALSCQGPAARLQEYDNTVVHGPETMDQDGTCETEMAEARKIWA